MKKIAFQIHFLGFLLFFLLMGFNSSFSQVPFFEKSFGQVGVDIAFAVKQSPDSCVYLFGYSSNTSTQAVDFELSKLSPNGDFLWTYYYGTPDVDFGLNMNLADSFDLILVGLKMKIFTYCISMKPDLLHCLKMVVFLKMKLSCIQTLPMDSFL